MSWQKVFESGLPCEDIGIMVFSDKAIPLTSDGMGDDADAIAMWTGALMSMKHAICTKGNVYQVGGVASRDFTSILATAEAISFQRVESYVQLVELMNI
jgi:hypothetical protein